MSGERADFEKSNGKGQTAGISTFPTFAVFYLLNAECDEGVTTAIRNNRLFVSCVTGNFYLSCIVTLYLYCETVTQRAYVIEGLLVYKTLFPAPQPRGSFSATRLFKRLPVLKIPAFKNFLLR